MLHSIDRIAGTVDPEMMLEGDDAGEGRHLGRPAQNFCAVNDVHPHDGELFVVELVGFVEDLLRGAHLADVVHQGRQAQFAQG
jgi:hypothetical protein